MMKILKTYRKAIIMVSILTGLYFFNKTIGLNAFKITLSNLKEFITIVPPIFLLVGLLDVWVPKETIIKLMGQNSGIKGIATAFFLATAAAGPLYIAFPIAALLLKKQARLAYVIFFLGVWSSTKLPIALYEIASLGLKFTIIHVGISLPLYLLVAFLIEKLTSDTSMNSIYEKAHSLTQ